MEGGPVVAGRERVALGQREARIVERAAQHERRRVEGVGPGPEVDPVALGAIEIGDSVVIDARRNDADRVAVGARAARERAAEAVRDNDVVARAAVDQRLVALQAVVAVAAVQRVAHAAGERVVTVPAIEGIIAVAADQDVVARLAVEGVEAADGVRARSVAGAQIVRTVAAIQDVAAQPAGQVVVVVAAVDDIGAVAAIQDVGARTARNRVGPGAAVIHVVGGRARVDVIARRAGQADGVVAARPCSGGQRRREERPVHRQRPGQGQHEVLIVQGGVAVGVDHHIGRSGVRPGVDADVFRRGDRGVRLARDEAEARVRDGAEERHVPTFVVEDGLDAAQIDLVAFGRREVRDPVVGGQRPGIAGGFVEIEPERVSAGAAGQGVAEVVHPVGDVVGRLRIAVRNDEVVARAAVDRIRAVAADQDVVAVAAQDRVVAAGPVQIVVGAQAADRFIGAGAGERVFAGGSREICHAVSQLEQRRRSGHRSRF